MAVQDFVDIFNDAIGVFGAKTQIGAINEASAAAAACVIAYPGVIKKLVRETDWNCLRYTTAMTDITSTFAPPGRWNFRYAMPTNCLALRRIENPTGVLWTWSPVPAPFQGFEILADLDPGNSNKPTVYLCSNYDSLSAVFTGYALDFTKGDYEATFDTSLRQAVASALAEQIVGSLTGNAQVVAATKSAAKEALAEARASGANEGGPNSMDVYPAESLTTRGFDAGWPMEYPLGRLLP